MPQPTNRTRRPYRYAVVVIPLRGREWVELVGEPGEAAADVEARAWEALRALWGDGPHYSTVRTLSYAGVAHAYPKELRYYEACREQEARRAQIAALAAADDAAAMDDAAYDRRHDTAPDIGE